MAILQVRDVDDDMYTSLKEIARRENRSLSQEVLSILGKYLSNPQAFAINPTREFLELSAAWEDDRTETEIAADIREARMAGDRFGDSRVFTD
ncbi:MAG: FitA-like ribbon-helix-helix domain-containing protein [Rectinemataceae bacterium]